jgi:hypothetical protein
MFKYLSCLGGSTSRCRFTTLMLMAFVAITFSSVAQAQLHGVLFLKGCTSPVRLCDSDDECSDANECTNDVCDLSIPDTTSCQIRIINTDGLNDTLIVNEAFDTMMATAGDVRVPAVGNLPITAVYGNTTCVVAGALPCTIGPDIGTGDGSVTFLQNTYVPADDDPNPLPDLGTVLLQDACDGTPDVGCSQLPFEGTVTAQTILVGGCDNPNLPVSTECTDDGDVCFAAGCDGNGVCVQDHVDNSACPDDPDCQFCDPVDGCILIDPQPDICVDDGRCRTPGFWGARGGIEKAPKSQNITQAVIDQAILENGSGLPVCGIYIDNTDLLSNMSAIEAMCVSVKGVTERQLVRQLTAAALNCVLGECNAEHTAMLAGCNAVCDSGVGDAGMCIDALDCFNNGGDWDGSTCITGAGFCAGSAEPCDDVNTCVEMGDFCLPDETCHDRDLCPDLDDDGDINGSDFCFEPPGPASSPRKCNAARKNDVYVP